MKLKSIAAAIALIGIGAGNAEAALTIGLDLGSPSNLVLSLVDNTTKNTYYKDLGINYAALVNGTANVSPVDLAADPVFGAALFSSGHTFSFNLSAAYAIDADGSTNQDKTSSFFNDPTGAQWGLISSLNTNLGSASSLVTGGFGELGQSTGSNDATNGNSIGFINGYFTSVGALLGTASSGKFAASGNPPTSSFDTLFQVGSPTVGGAKSLVSGAGATGGELWWITNPTGAVNVLSKLGDISLSGAGVLSISSDVAAVPVPAAVWLLGSALVGFAGIARREDKKAA